jgi:hypothetical protein
VMVTLLGSGAPDESRSQPETRPTKRRERASGSHRPVRRPS